MNDVPIQIEVSSSSMHAHAFQDFSTGFSTSFLDLEHFPRWQCG